MADTVQPASSPTLSVDSFCATIRLNRPAQHNRLEPTDIETLLGLCDQIARRADIRVVLLTAIGKSFCAGYHLGELVSRHDASGALPERMPLDLLGDAVERLPQPTIAVLNGPVYGAGSDLALACDFRIGVPETRLTVPVATLGGAYGGRGLRRFATRLGLSAAKRIFLCGETFDAEALQAIGYLDAIADPSKLGEVTATWVDRLTAKAPIAVAAMKRVLNDIARAEFDEAVAREGQQRTRKSSDYAEGLAAVAAKREPDFKGR
jgi:enoyl-CoA hydratase/carnithine racemase